MTWNGNLSQAEAMSASHRLSSQRAALRADLRFGRVSITDVLADPPPAAAELLVYELLRVARGVGRTTLTTIGRRAVIDDVNLFVPVGRCSSRTRRWLADQLGPHPRRGPVSIVKRAA